MSNLVLILGCHCSSPEPCKNHQCATFEGRSTVLSCISSLLGYSTGALLSYYAPARALL